MMSKPKLLNVLEAASYLNTTETILRRAYRQGRIEYVRYGRTTYFTHEQLDRFIERHTFETTI